MAYSVREERRGLATSLREDLAEAERLIVQLRRDNVEAFLQLMDRIEESFTLLETSGLDLRPEQTRWGSLLSKLTREAGRVVRTMTWPAGWASCARPIHRPRDCGGSSMRLSQPLDAA